MGDWSWLPLAGCAWAGASLAAAVFGSKIASLAPPEGFALAKWLVPPVQRTEKGTSPR